MKRERDGRDKSRRGEIDYAAACVLFDTVVWAICQLLEKVKGVIWF